jgi:hypothetical protein
MRWSVPSRWSGASSSVRGSSREVHGAFALGGCLALTLVVISGLLIAAGSKGQDVAPKNAAATQAAPQASAQSRESQQATGVTPAIDPHWQQDGCVHCHSELAAGGQTVKPISTKDATRLCLTCHDGVRATREPHPIGRGFENTSVVAPQGWPLAEGKLECLTCHDALLACKKDVRRPERGADFLRSDPSPSLIGFCQQCHVPTGHELHNPHLMLTADGKANPNACRYCHSEDMPQEFLSAQQREGQPVLRADEILLCIGCHTTHVDYGDPGHLGRVVPPEILVRLADLPAPDRFEQSILKQAVSEVGTPRSSVLDVAEAPVGARRGAGSTQAAPGAPDEARLPLGSGNTIVCSTCHNPHARGLFAGDRPLGYGGHRISDEGRLPLRGYQKDICHACHDQ